MNWKLPATILTLVALGGGAAYSILRSTAGSDAGGHDGHDHGPHDHGAHGAAAHSAEETAKGPHGGRLVREGMFTVELAIFERGAPPEFRAWFTRGGNPVAPRDVILRVELTRPGGAKDAFTFLPEGDYARGDREVEEPHSFDYSVAAEYAGRSYRWNFPAPEMQVTIPAEAAQRAGVVVLAAGPSAMRETLAVYGQIKLNGNKVGRAVSRFGGIVREARKAIGDTVAAGEVVAIIETNQSLVSLEVKAPLAGVIVDRDVNAGETVADAATLYSIADLSEVWIDLHIPKRDYARAKVGQTAVIHADNGGEPIRGTISWIAPTGSVEAQTVVARVVLPNAEHRWRPGLFVKAEITLAETVVPIAVKVSAVQTLFNATVVFSQHGDLYQARPLELGRRSGGYVEVLKGLSAGERYVAENSFLLKADIGKSGASHDH